LLLAAPIGIRIPLELLTSGTAPRSTPELLVDASSDEARAFMASARVSSSAASFVTADATSIISRISESWRGGARPLFGLTRTSIGVLVEALARSHGMALAYRGWHDDGPGGVTHALSGSPAAIEALRSELIASRMGWGRVLGCHVNSLTILGRGTGSENFRLQSTRNGTTEQLVSWAFAPAGTAART
jgi:hypothetical protein